MYQNQTTAAASQGYQITGGAIGGAVNYATADARPDTLNGIVARLEAALKKANAVRNHVQDTRTSLMGGYPEDAYVNKADVPRPVPNGFIERANELLASLEYTLASADDHLEAIHSRIG